ncbi:MAG: hypothetical protein H6855_03960 [Rhodospirillales bacterium]|nr:hypothetical protein [Rhodospirillales bacterium]MCB9980391.1 hypothetical protein [Rhodospirillales bacterium]
MPLSQFLTLAFFGLVGGLAGSLLLPASPLQAALSQGNYSSVQTYNGQGYRTSSLGAGTSGQGTLFLFDENGQGTVQIGSYDDGAEKGQGLIGLNDRQGHLRFLLRLHNATDAPTLVMKDRRGRDRIVIGLDANEDPYFKYVTAKGVMKDLIHE